MKKLWVAITAIIFVWASNAIAGEQDTELAKKIQNPVADLISIPFQSNFNFEVGPNDSLQYIMNVQPVYPIELSEDWNLIQRPIFPLVDQPGFAPGQGYIFGLGDIQYQAYLSPAKASPFIWGFGPLIVAPSATSPVLGQGKWDAGPTGVILVIEGPIVAGALANQVWSFTGQPNRPMVSQFLLQPFFNYNFPGGIYFSSSPVMTANWRAPSGQQWTVPVGGGLGKIIRVGKLPLNTYLQAYDNVIHPTLGGDWSLRFQVAILLPAKK